MSGTNHVVAKTEGKHERSRFRGLSALRTIQLNIDKESYSEQFNGVVAMELHELKKATIGRAIWITIERAMRRSMGRAIAAKALVQQKLRWHEKAMFSIDN